MGIDEIPSFERIRDDFRAISIPIGIGERQRERESGDESKWWESESSDR